MEGSYSKDLFKSLLTKLNSNNKENIKVENFTHQYFPDTSSQCSFNRTEVTQTFSKANSQSEQSVTSTIKQHQLKVTSLQTMSSTGNSVSADSSSKVVFKLPSFRSFIEKRPITKNNHPTSVKAQNKHAAVHDAHADSDHCYQKRGDAATAPRSQSCPRQPVTSVTQSRSPIASTVPTAQRRSQRARRESCRIRGLPATTATPKNTRPRTHSAPTPRNVATSGAKLISRGVCRDRRLSGPSSGQIWVLPTANTIQEDLQKTLSLASFRPVSPVARSSVKQHKARLVTPQAQTRSPTVRRCLKTPVNIKYPPLSPNPQANRDARQNKRVTAPIRDDVNTNTQCRSLTLPVVRREHVRAETWVCSDSSGSDDDVSYVEGSSDFDDDDAFETDSSSSDGASLYFPGDEELSDFDVIDWLHRLTSCEQAPVAAEVQSSMYNEDALEMLHNKNLYVWQLIEAIG